MVRTLPIQLPIQHLTEKRKPDHTVGSYLTRRLPGEITVESVLTGEGM